MKKLSFPLLVVVATTAMIGLGWMIGHWRRVPSGALSVSGAARGAHLFRTHCASCHGDDGRADGIAAAELRPPPRDFAARPWRFEPTSASIRQATREGIPGTAMPAFKNALASADLDLIVAHVQDLAARGPALDRPLSSATKLALDAHFIDLNRSTTPPLILENARGETTKLADYRGKLVLLHFWGTSCPHCIKEMPVLRDLEQALAGRLRVVHVCIDEDDAAKAQAFLDRISPGATSYVDPSGLAPGRFEAQTLPTSWLLAPDGKALGRGSGARDWKSPEIRNWIEHCAKAFAE